MSEKEPISRLADFIITTVWLSFFNFIVVYANYLDLTKRITRSLLVAATAGLILALIRPTINAWIKPMIKRNKNTNAGILIRFIIFAVAFGAITYISLLHLREDANWSMTKILTKSLLVGVVSGIIFSLLFWLIKKIRGNKNDLQNSD